MDLCEIDTTSSPPALRIPERFNAAHDLLDRNLRAGREAKYAYMLHDSRAQMAVISEPLLPKFQPILGQSPFLKHVLVAGSAVPPPGMRAFNDVLAASAESFEPAPTSRDEPCFWLYSSGSTGAPKATVHVHSSLIETAALYAQATLGLKESDVMLSGAKLFFAYGLGNSLTFPLAVGG